MELLFVLMEKKERYKTPKSEKALPCVQILKADTQGFFYTEIICQYIESLLYITGLTEVITS